MNSAIATLVVYAYSSFVSSWGPGPDMAKGFEKQCHCHVKMIDVGDGGTLIGRLQLEKEKTRADILLGLDETALPKLKTVLHWNVEAVLFDHGPFAFVYHEKNLSEPPQSLDDLLDPRFKKTILLEDPRLSTTGLGFLLWVVSEKGTSGTPEYLKKLKPQVKMISPSWDLAYGIFKKGADNIVFSYWTSPAYHIQEEKRHDIKAAPFKEGHYVQREYAVATPGSKNQDLKTQFLTYLLSEEAQEILPKKNFMFPARKGTVLPPAFKEIGEVKELPRLEKPSVDQWLEVWSGVFSK